MLLGIISVLGRGGLPIHCGGLTRKDAWTIRPEPPFDTIGFSDGTLEQLGELDKLCAFEHPYFAIANILVSVLIRPPEPKPC